MKRQGLGNREGHSNDEDLSAGTSERAIGELR